jgi:(R,R)-butanediol dehydrogenase/meso-butanediol dehydrogenase/diacetyl reductase
VERRASTWPVEHAGVRAGQTAVVRGAGPIVLLLVAVLKAKGLTTIVSEMSTRREKALSSGVADVVVDPANEDLRAVVEKRTAGAGAEVVFDAAGVPAVVEQLLCVLGAGGRLGSSPSRPGRWRSTSRRSC